MSRTKEYLENLHYRYLESEWFMEYVQRMEAEEKEYFLTLNEVYGKS